MVIREQLIANYRYWRSQSQYRGRAYEDSARRCLMNARRDLWEGVRRYPISGNPWNPLHEGDRFLESEKNSGLRLLGFVDEIARSKDTGQRIDHKGWYCRENDYSDVYRGVVFQLPGKNSKARYLAGYAAEFGYVVEMSVIEGEKLDSSYDTDSELRVAIRRADSMAENAAEEAREYDRAWQAGRLWADNGETIATFREQALAILKERKGFKSASAPVLCAAIRDKVDSLLESIRELRQERETLANGDYSHGDCYLGFWPGDKRLKDAFNEGANKIVIA